LRLGYQFYLGTEPGEIRGIPAEGTAADQHSLGAGPERSADGPAAFGYGSGGNGTGVDYGQIGGLVRAGGAQIHPLEELGYLLGLVLVSLAADDFYMVCSHTGPV